MCPFCVMAQSNLYKCLQTCSRPKAKLMSNCTCSLSGGCKVVWGKIATCELGGQVKLCGGFVCQPSAERKEILQDVVLSAPNGQQSLPSKVLGVLGKHDLHGVLIVLLGPAGASADLDVSYWLGLRKLCLLAESFTQISSVYLNFQTLHCVQSAAGWTFTKLSLPWQVLNDHLPTAGPDPDIPDWLVIAPHQPVFPGPA